MSAKDYKDFNNVPIDVLNPDYNKKVPYMKLNIFFMRLMGVYRIHRNASVATKILFYFWRYLTLLALISFAILTGIDLVTRDVDFVQKAPNCLHTVLYAAGFLRTLYLILRERKLEYLIEKMRTKFKYSSDGLENPETMKQYVFLSDLSTILQTINFMVAAFLITILPIAFRYETGYVLPFSTWYPWDWLEYYTPSYLHQILSNFILGFAYANPDMLYASMVLLAAKQWEVVNDNMKNFIFTALYRYGVSKEKVIAFSHCYNNYGIDKNPDLPKRDKSKQQLDEIKQMEQEVIEIIRCEEFDKVLKEVFVECIEEHRQMMIFSEEIQDFLSLHAFNILGFGTLYMIFMIFVITMTKSKSTVIGVLQYYSCAMIQVFLFCFLGHIFMVKSEDLQWALWTTPWYVCSERFKSCFKFAFLRSAKFKMLTAMEVFIVRREVFISLTRTTFSVYLLLRQFNTKNANELAQNGS